ncbi:TomO hydrophobic C-terminal domain-containing protein [Wolbachia endosymbiont of Diaphorina citri]|jgi:hypothetical protein|uniref:TomO hydrophobic C-terminal domain-containing protein n=1 Tax=Wolbachia endosymbiont of Diaphorina citri TaxID=116598 RepID=UPI00031C3DDD|nr:hypothetical protein [Wolbachia endosymbiont of Diaphorina citri]
MGDWNLSAGLMSPAVDTAEKEKERRHSRDSGNESQEEVSVDNSDTEDTPSNGANTLKFQLTQSLLSQVKASENNGDANSGKQAYKDLPRMDFVINGQVIDKNFVSQLRDKCNQNDQRQIAKHVFTKMFEHAKAEIPNDNLLEELINSCNQAGYDGSLLMQLSPIFLGHDLQLPDANDRHIEIVCSDQDSLNIKYCPNMPVKQLDKEICRVDAILEFTLKSQDGKVEYEDGKVTLTIPEKLKNYKVDGKSLLDDIKMHFEDVDNAIIESLLENIDEGQNSFVVDLSTQVNSDSFDIIPEDTVFDLGHIPELVKKAVDDKDVNALADHIGFFQDHVTHVSSKEGLPVVEKTLEIVSGFTKEQSKPWRCYPTVPIASHIYSVKQQYYDGYISQEGYEKLKKMEETLCKIKSDLIKRSSNDPNEESPVKNAQDTSAILNETPTSSQAVNQEDNNQLSTKESKSTDNQQLQSGIVDEGENIMDNKKASKEAISNNYRRGKMHSSDQNIKTVGEMLFDAISSFDCKKVRSLVEQAKQEGNNVEPIMNEAFKKANETRVKQQSTASRKKLKKIKEFLKKELDNIAILSMSNDVETTVSRQEVPVVESEGSESDSLSLSSEKDDFSKLEGDKSDCSAGTSSDSNSNSPFEKISEEGHETRISVIDTVEAEATANGTVSSNSVPCTFRVELTSDDEDEFLSIEFEDVNNDINVNQPTEHVEQVANGNGQPKTELPRINEQSSKSGLKKNSQNTKKYVVAASALAITGIALGVAVAVYLEMLAIGVAVAACCLIAATITYCYRPKSLVEDNEVKKVDDTQKSTPCCG